MNWTIAAFVVALAISSLSTPYIRRLAMNLNVMVYPGGRRVHTRPMPLWGGLAIYLAFMIAVVALISVYPPVRDPHNPHQYHPVVGLLVSVTVIMIIGLIDDMKELSAAVQSIGIVSAALILASFGVRVEWLSKPFSGGMWHIPTALSWMLTLAWVFLVTKTVDFMDGLDGLAAGIGAIAAGVLGIMAYYSGQMRVALMAASLCGACIGFLRFNFNPAKIFMGTGGSQMIGFVLAAISIIGAFKVAASMAIALPVLVLGVPIFDAIRVFANRLLKRQPLHVADRSHLHHKLLERGFSQKQAVFIMYIISAVLAIAALTWFVYGYLKR